MFSFFFIHTFLNIYRIKIKCFIIQKYIFLTFKYHLRTRNHLIFSKTPLPFHILNSLYLNSGLRKQNTTTIYNFVLRQPQKPLLTVPNSTLSSVSSPLPVSCMINIAKTLPETCHIPVQKPHMTFHCLNLSGHSMSSPP